jgi:hypothetical protein
MDAWPPLFEQVGICDTPLQPSQRPYPHRRSLGKMMDIAHVQRRDTAPDTAPDTPEYRRAPRASFGAHAGMGDGAKPPEPKTKKPAIAGFFVGDSFSDLSEFYPLSTNNLKIVQA